MGSVVDVVAVGTVVDEEVALEVEEEEEEEVSETVVDVAAVEA